MSRAGTIAEMLPGHRQQAIVAALAGLNLLLAASAPAEPPGSVVSDPSSINVCERVPGGEVAKALGKALRSQRPIVVKESKLSRCVYIVGPPAKPAGIQPRGCIGGLS